MQTARTTQWETPADDRERRSADDRRQASRRACDDRVTRILMGECDHLHWVIDEHLVFSEPCGKCLPCRAKSALKAAGLTESIARDLASTATRRTARAAGSSSNVVPLVKTA